MMKSKKVKNVGEYIKSFPPKTSLKLRRIRTIIRQIAPEAEEKISYNIPAYKLNGLLVYFAGFEKHISIYPRTKALEKAIGKELNKHKSGRGTIKFPLDESLPVHLIQKIIRQRVKENLAKKKKLVK